MPGVVAVLPLSSRCCCEVKSLFLACPQLEGEIFIARDALTAVLSSSRHKHAHASACTESPTLKAVQPDLAHSNMQSLKRRRGPGGALRLLLMFALLHRPEHRRRDENVNG